MTSRFVAALALLIMFAGSARAAEFIMFDQDGCYWCQRFEAEIAPAWPNTEQGKLAPLRRVDIHDPLPEDLTWITVERFTPSFVLVEDGKEIARLRGYPGDQFFWHLVDGMLAKLDP